MQLLVQGQADTPAARLRSPSTSEHDDSHQRWSLDAFVDRRGLRLVGEAGPFAPNRYAGDSCVFVFGLCFQEHCYLLLSVVSALSSLRPSLRGPLGSLEVVLLGVQWPSGQDPRLQNRSRDESSE